jgi:hypothetical protein
LEEEVARLKGRNEQLETLHRRLEPMLLAIVALPATQLKDWQEFGSPQCRRFARAVLRDRGER